jgi:threonylcarbamoyladenosine tRNA methylthiotransferase MtaB
MKIAFQTLGCRLNQYDTQLLREMARDAQYEVTNLHNNPELVIVNSCSVTMNAAQQARNAVRRARRASPCATIIVTGCFPPDASEMLHEADRFVNNREKQHFFNTLFSSRRHSITRFDRHTRAHVKIQTGCNHFCTYCTVPYLRDRERSRSPGEIVAEISALVAHGFREITLTGIHIGRYQYGGKNLVGLLEDITTIEGLRRIRLSSLNPEEISEHLIETMAASSTICHHIHMSLQSADEDILHAMRRDYSMESVAGKLALISSQMPDCGIGADTIVGFPGETEHRFQHTHSFIESMPFTYLHVFRYSPRKGTLAALYPQRVPEKEKKRRGALLRQLGLRKSIAFRTRYRNQTITVLIESKRDKKTNFMVGFSGNYIRILIPPRAKMPGTFQNVLIENIDQYDTFGTFC